MAKALTTGKASGELLARALVAVVADPKVLEVEFGLGLVRVVVGHAPVPMEFVAIKDAYAKSGKPSELLERYGLTARDIEHAVHAVLKKRG